jgi:hypothetical protein
MPSIRRRRGWTRFWLKIRPVATVVSVPLAIGLALFGYWLVLKSIGDLTR